MIKLKLVLAIVNNDDSPIVTSTLTRDGFFVTTLSTTGGFLNAGNRTLLIGTEEDKIDTIKDILKQTCSTRKQKKASDSSLGRGLYPGSPGEEVTVGGATSFVLDVEDFGKV